MDKQKLKRLKEKLIGISKELEKFSDEEIEKFEKLSYENKKNKEEIANNGYYLHMASQIISDAVNELEKLENGK